MGVALNVLLLAVAVIAVVAGIGALLALRVPRRRPQGASRPTSAAARPPSPAGTAAVPRPGAAAPKGPVAAPSTADSVAARLAAMRELLAHGDREHAARAAQGDSQQFADTQAFDEDYPPTMTIPRGSLVPPSPLLNLDKAPGAPQAPKSAPPTKRRA